MRWPHTLLCVLVVGNVVEQCVADAPIAVLAGFVRASTKLSEAGVTVDYTQNEIKVQLLNALDDGSAGHVRDSSRVRPNGGYMVPVYDHGKYVLRVSLEGWSFAPDQRLIDVTNVEEGDGSKFKNLNFEFTGFSVSGHVSGSSKPSCKDASAPQGVVLSLVKGDAEVGSTKTDVSGKFTFDNIPPGKYSVSASSDEFKLEDSIQEVEVSGPNTKLSKAIHVVGYSLSGSVLAGTSAVEGVKIFLYSDDEEVACENQSDDMGALPERAGKPNCLATSSKSGDFSFQYLACGQYTLVPHYKEQFAEGGSADAVTSFDVTPHELKVDLGHKSLTLADKFQVVGFSASGRVVDENGAGVSDAKVFVDGKQKAVTNEQGYYNLAGMTTGAYNIEAKKQHMVFAPLTKVELTPQSGVAADVKLSAYSLCGSVHSAESLGNREIKLTGKGKTQTTKTDAKGAYCFEAAPGDYVVNAVVTSAEETRGMLLSPTDQRVTVAGKPVLDVDFSQAKVSIAGSVQCVAGCPSDMPVLLRNTRTEKVVRQTVDPASGKFAFKDVLPGKYSVSIKYERFCWEKSSHNVQVNLEDATGIKFAQTGFLMNVESQVPITLRTSLIPAHSYANVKQDSKHIGDHQLEKGKNAICLPSQGQYKLEPISCYRFAGFESGVDTFDTDKVPHKPVQLQVTHYQMKGALEVVKSTPFSGQLALSIVSPKRTSSDNVVYAKKSDKGSKEADGVDLYEFEFWAEEREEIELVPHVSDPNDKSGLLFYPRKLAVRVSNRLHCQAPLKSFEARKGIYVTGNVAPGVEGVQITVDYVSGKTPSTVVKTDKTGKYVAGPLYDDVAHKISALKSGYHLKEDLNNAGSFTAMELGKIEVRVLASSAGEAPVEGALISLSGSGETPFSANEQTDKDGILRFTDLTPGLYFLQPFFKEYEFEPNFDQIEIESGTAAVQKFDARRVAYSAFGSVRSLNGKAERGAKVHATAYSEDGKQVIHHEEGTVEESGDFRIRGLNPSFEYKINVDTGGASNRIARASPEEVTIQVEEKDHVGLEFIAFRHLNNFDVSGHVENFQSKAPHPVRVTLTSKHLKETVTVNELNYFEFPSLPANDIYQLSYSRGADTPHGRIDNRKLDTLDLTEHVHLSVRAPKSTSEAHDDLSGGGLLGLVAFVLVATVFFNRSSVLRVYSDISDARAGGQEDASARKRKSKVRRT